MKKAKKVLSFILVLALTITGTIVGTIAYLTDTDDAQNTFTTGNVDITLFESEVEEGENEDGFYSYVDKDGEKRTVKLNTYDNLVPGSTICKDPTVTNVGSEDAYIRVTVKHNNNAAIFNYFTEEEFMNSVVGLADTIALAEHVDVAWKLADGTFGSEPNNVRNLEGELEADEKVYVFYFEDALTKDQAITLFTEINVPTTFDNVEMAAFEDLEIDIHADAIQANGFDNVMEAFDAFDAQFAPQQ